MTDSITRILTRAVASGLAPGLVAGWQSSDDPSPHVVAVGRASVTPPSRPMTGDTWFDLASLTKPLVVGTLSLQAMRDESLSPENTVGEILPESAHRSVGGLTIGQLLTHSSGLPAWEPIYALTAGNPDRALESVLGLEIDDPGSHVVYSCPGFILMGKILERLWQQNLHRLFVDRVVTPLNLGGELGFRPASAVRLAGGASVPAAEELLVNERGLDAGLIPPYSPGWPDDGNSRFLGGMAGNAGLFGTARGVLALARVYLGTEEFLSAEEITVATTNHTPGLEQGRGFGWQVAVSPGCSAGPALHPTAFGHTGFTGTSLWVDPVRGMAMTLLTNRVHPGHRPTDLHPLRRRFHHLIVG